MPGPGATGPDRTWRLGVTQLTRTSRSVALTDAGHRLLDNAGPAVDQALESLKTVRAKRGEVTGRVRLTVPSVSVSLVLADLLPRFVARYPKVDVEVHVDDRLVNTVAGEFDAGMRLIESIDRDMVHVRLSGPTAWSWSARRRTSSERAYHRSPRISSSTTVSASVGPLAENRGRGSSSVARRPTAYRFAGR